MWQKQEKGFFVNGSQVLLGLLGNRSTNFQPWTKEDRLVGSVVWTQPVRVTKKKNYLSLVEFQALWLADDPSRWAVIGSSLLPPPWPRWMDGWMDVKTFPAAPAPVSFLLLSSFTVCLLIGSYNISPAPAPSLTFSLSQSENWRVSLKQKPVKEAQVKFWPWCRFVLSEEVKMTLQNKTHVVFTPEAQVWVWFD